jgi:hypothetical protein
MLLLLPEAVERVQSDKLSVWKVLASLETEIK